MASATASVIVLAFWLLFVQQVDADFLRKVSVSEVESDVQATLSYFSDLSPKASRRLATIEASTWQTFQALPKNAAGRLSPPSVRYLVHGYFAREHGWLIKGLEPHGNNLNISQVHDVSILQDRAPLLVEGLLEARQSDRGLAHNDIVTMVAVLEQMMFDESVTLLQAAYHLNGLPLDVAIDRAALHKVLKSYLLLFGQGSKANLVDGEKHRGLVNSDARWDIEEFQYDEVLNYEFANRHLVNPFKTRSYSFHAAAEIMAVLAQQYGKWQNTECRDMKSHLVELDPEGLGRVPLGLFYAQPELAAYHFSESADYLRKIGALDETSPGNPQVYLANYVQGPSNCVASSSYYSVCCISECSQILGDLERQVAAPTASPEKLLWLAGNVSHTVFPQNLQDKLHAVAARHGGEVPLHGRLFAQWLHFAFPHECPYPTVIDSPTVMSPSQWVEHRATATAEEREHHLTSANAAPGPEAFDIDVRWSDHEVLPAHDQPAAPMGTGAIRILVQLVTVVVVLRSAVAAWQATKSTQEDNAKKNDDHSTYGMYV